MRLNKYFKREEFICKCGECSKIAVDKELLDVLTDIREWADDKVIINSGNRCEKHNREIGGAKHSRHLDSIAADIVVNGKPTEDVYFYLDTKYPNKYGIGLYDTWVHIDVRPNKARWAY